MAQSLVRVHDLTPRGGAGARLSVVSGLCPAELARSDGYAPFLPDAVAPRGEWRAATPRELSALVAKPEVHRASDVIVISLPRLAARLADHLRKQTDFSSLQKAVRDLQFVQTLQGCLDDLVPFCLRPAGLVCQGACVNQGGMQLVTHNTDLVPPLRIGLHVDNWDDLPLRERSRGRRRLCVNLGSRPRYLVFLQTPLSALAAAGMLPADAPRNVAPTVLVRHYLGRNLGHLAARLRIDPGEAYVVNADDVIHDGATETREVPDVALHFLGHFGPGPAVGKRFEALSGRR